MGALHPWRAAGLFPTAKNQAQDPYLLLVGAVLSQAVRDARGLSSHGWTVTVQADAVEFLHDSTRLGVWVEMVDADVDDIQTILLAVTSAEAPRCKPS